MKLIQRLSTLVVVLVAACGKHEPAAKTADLSTHEGIVDAMIGVRTDLVAVLEGITDPKSAEAAKPALKEVAKRERAVLEALENIGEPEGEEKQRLNTKIEAAMSPLDARMRKATERLRADAGLQAVIDQMMEDYLDAADPNAGKMRSRAAQMEDMNRMRQLAGLAIVAEKLPLKDGAFDPYAFVATGDVTRENYDCFRSARLRKGPTDEQIARGDYSSFPWERYRGAEMKRFERIPLLWEKEPGPDGQHLVAYTDGSCSLSSTEELQAALKR